MAIILTFCETTKGQDAEFSQFLNNPLHLNPAFTGVGIGPRFIVNYRNEWPSLNKAYTTYAASYDQHIENINSGIGFSAFSDIQGNGLYSNLQFNGFYSYQFKMNKKYAFKIGFNSSFAQLKLDNTNFIFTDMINPNSVSVTNNTGEILPINQTKSYLDFGFGLLIFSKKMFLGLGIKHITQPNISFYTSDKSSLPVRFALHFGHEFKKNKRSKSFFTPNFLLVQQDRFRQINAGVMAGTGVLLTGLNYRYTINNADAISLILGVKKGVFKTVYSYDITTSGLKGKSGGTHEISIAINLGDQKNAERKRKQKRYTECPSIL